MERRAWLKGTRIWDQKTWSKPNKNVSTTYSNERSEWINGSWTSYLLGHNISLLIHVASSHCNGLFSIHTCVQESHSRCEVCGGGGCFGGVCVQSGSPDSAFVTQKRSNPVPCVSLAQHGLAIWWKKNREDTEVTRPNSGHSIWQMRRKAVMILSTGVC